MKWSKLKKEIELRLAEKLKGRLSFFTTTYANSSLGRSWITFDKIQVANFETMLSYTNFGAYCHPMTYRQYMCRHEGVKDNQRTPDLPMERGEFSQFDFLNACWDYLQLNIEEALESENPIIKSIAMVDRRLGKRRLQEINFDDLHPLTKLFLSIRLQAENIEINDEKIRPINN
jgi:hypothetical protein